MKLFYRELGQGQPILILHGLLGSSDNWLTQAKLLAENYKVYFLDQRNHGQSPHSDEHTYDLMAEDLKEFIDSHQLNTPIIIGHSMGGKTAMRFVSKYPQQVNVLIVVDIAPKAYNIHHDHIMEGLMAIPIKTLASRHEADKILSRYVEEADVRQFLLKNLSRKAEGGFTWKANVPVLNKCLPEIVQAIELPVPFEKATLFIRGKNSNYVRDEDRALIKKYFPKSDLLTMDTGHWVQAEKPQEFVSVVHHYLSCR
ncbi:MAG: alpha/beta fold hydrolase [Flammeovirgaceae bacterium]|nr:alpha/beta fold hydrolase [Flammeovirgaceae bacterium]